MTRDDDDPLLAMPTLEAYMTSLQKHWDVRLDTEDELYSPSTTVYVELPFYRCDFLKYCELQPSDGPK
jgi:hypothetical protein